jgi:Na+/proline symporter
MLGAFLLGVLTTRATGQGAIAGMVVATACMLAIKFETTIAWTWYVLIGTTICCTVGYGFSLLKPPAGVVTRPS